MKYFYDKYTDRFTLIDLNGTRFTLTAQQLLAALELRKQRSEYEGYIGPTAEDLT